MCRQLQLQWMLLVQPRYHRSASQLDAGLELDSVADLGKTGSASTNECELNTANSITLALFYVAVVSIICI